MRQCKIEDLAFYLNQKEGITNILCYLHVLLINDVILCGSL